MALSNDVLAVALLRPHIDDAIGVLFRTLLGNIAGGMDEESAQKLFSNGLDSLKKAEQLARKALLTEPVAS